MGTNIRTSLFSTYTRRGRRPIPHTPTLPSASAGMSGRGARGLFIFGRNPRARARSTSPCMGRITQKATPCGMETCCFCCSVILLALQNLHVGKRAKSILSGNPALQGRARYEGTALGGVGFHDLGVLVYIWRVVNACRQGRGKGHVNENKICINRVGCPLPFALAC